MWYNWFSLYLFFWLFGHFFWLSLTVPHLCSWIGINPAKFPLAVVDANNVFCRVSLLIHDIASFNPQVVLLAIMCWRMTKSRVERKLTHLCLTAGSITHMLVLGNGFLTKLTSPLSGDPMLLKDNLFQSLTTVTTKRVFLSSIAAKLNTLFLVLFTMIKGKSSSIPHCNYLSYEIHNLLSVSSLSRLKTYPSLYCSV